LTGGACLVGGAIRDYQFLAGKSRRLYKSSYPEGHIVYCVALQTEPLNVYPYVWPLGYTPGTDLRSLPRWRPGLFNLPIPLRCAFGIGVSQKKRGGF